MKILQQQAVKNIITRIDSGRCNDIMNTITPFLVGHKTILDVGVGFGVISKRLKEKGFSVVSMDVRNTSLFDEIPVVIYDGKKIPFKINTFDVAQLITVLHHTNNPEKILKEVKRVAKKIIIMEDTYEGKVQKYLTYLMDCIGNMEFWNHPHTNKSDRDWRELFDRLGLTLKEVYVHNFWYLFTSTTYYLVQTQQN